MSRTSFVSALLAFAVVSSAANGAFAYCRTTTEPVPPDYRPRAGVCWTEGKLLYWANKCVSFSVNSKGSKQFSADAALSKMTTAFGTWNAANCEGGLVSIKAESRGKAECGEIAYNQNAPNQNIVLFQDDKWPHNDSNNTLGLTTITFDRNTGEIYDADMEINTAQQTITLDDPVPQNGYDFLSIVTHEAGHFLGLAHSAQADATMFAAYRPGSTALRSITPDDNAGLCAIYPTNGDRVTTAGIIASGPCDNTPRHGYSSVCASDQPIADGGGKTCSCSTVGAPIGGPGGIVAAALAVCLGLTANRRRPRRR
jgi:hypothetical protein